MIMSRAASACSARWAAARNEHRSGRVKPGWGMGSSSVAGWEEFGRPHPARTALNRTQPG